MKNEIKTTNDNVKEISYHKGNYSPKEINDNQLGSKAQAVSKVLSGVFATLAVSIGAVSSLSLLPTAPQETATLPVAEFVESGAGENDVFYHIKIEDDEIFSHEDFTVTVSNYFTHRVQEFTEEDFFYYETEEGLWETSFGGHVEGLATNMDYDLQVKYKGQTVAHTTHRTKPT